MSSTDTLLRAMTDDGAFRVIAAITTSSVREANRLQEAKGALAQRFGDLLTGSVLVRETMAPKFRVQALVRGAKGQGGLVADSHPDGGTRGLVQKSKVTGDVSFGEGAILQMLRTMPNGSLHTGTVEIPPDLGVSGALMQYFATSEQVASMVAVGSVLSDEGNVVLSGGYIVQLLPEVVDGPLAVMTERLSDFTDMRAMLAGGLATPEGIIDEILYQMPYTKLETSPLEWKCRCSELSLLSSISTLSQDEILDLVKDDEPLDISCDYCRTDYKLEPEQLRGLLHKS
jgi:molecular chaperone Hsp33